MAKHLLRTAIFALVLCTGAVQAQRIAFVDTKYILSQMPEYAAAQQELDRNSKGWQKEIDDRWSQIQRLKDAFNAEAILLTEEMKKSRQEEIAKKEQEARDLQQKRFGVGGDLFKKRQELVQPIQDRIFDAVKEVAGTSYVAIFDIGGAGNNVLYASEKYDKSDSVLRKLGHPVPERTATTPAICAATMTKMIMADKQRQTKPGQNAPRGTGGDNEMKPKQ
jgi:outer membrane protein